MTTSKCLLQKSVLNSDIRIKICAQTIAHNIKLSAQTKCHLAFFTINFVCNQPIFLIVVGLRNGTSPVHNQRNAVLIGNTSGSNIHALRRTSSSHLQNNFGKIRLQQKGVNAFKTIRVKIVFLIVNVYNSVKRFNCCIGFHCFVVRAKVLANFA